MSWRRVRAVSRKELKEFRHNRNILYAMMLLPVIFLIQPLIQVFRLDASASAALRGGHALVFMLAIPALVPAVLASYAVVGERVQGTLEPLLTTPIRRDELLLGKAAAAFLPAVAVSYGAFVVFGVVVELFAAPGIASGLLQAPDVLAQVLFTPLLAGLSIWIALAVSVRATDPRAASQLAFLISIPAVAVTTLVSAGVIPATLPVAVAFGAALLVLNGLGWRFVAAIFDRERLIAGAG